MSDFKHTRRLWSDRGLQAVGFCTFLSAIGCEGGASSSSGCTPGDQDGVVGGHSIVLLTVSDMAFAVGGVDSGSDQRNIAVQNSSTVTMTLTNVGTKPHSLVVACIPTGLPAGCPSESCLPASANISALEAGQTATTTFNTPAVEGAYPFASDVPGDTQIVDGTATGLVGEFVLM